MLGAPKQWETMEQEIPFYPDSDSLRWSSGKEIDRAIFHDEKALQLQGFMLSQVYSFVYGKDRSEL